MVLLGTEKAKTIVDTALPFDCRQFPIGPEMAILRGRCRGRSRRRRLSGSLAFALRLLILILRRGIIISGTTGRITGLSGRRSRLGRRCLFLRIGTSNLRQAGLQSLHHL